VLCCYEYSRLFDIDDNQSVQILSRIKPSVNFYQIFLINSRPFSAFVATRWA
jgi:hypothetical protein